ncbi:unnamed protein product, partial [Polarella glacialis]
VEGSWARALSLLAPAFKGPATSRQSGDLSGWNAAAAACADWRHASQGAWCHGLSLLRDVADSRASPDELGYHCAARGCGHGGSWQAAVEVELAMQR